MYVIKKEFYLLSLNLPSDVLEEFKKIINTETNKIYKKDAFIIENQKAIMEIVSTFIDISSYHYGTIFSHSNPFTIHSDISDKKKTILLIPIEADKDQNFVVFDQTVDRDSPISWIYNVFADKTDEELKEMYYESAYKTRPYDTENVIGCSNKPVNNDLFEHLPYTKDLYFGLTGRAWSYTPGTALLFPANRIHATGKMKSPKIGCTIQFRDSIDNLRTSLKAHILS